MATEGKGKKRKAIALANDAPQKLHKKSKKSVEEKKDLVKPTPAVESVTSNGSKTTTKSKEKARKRAADFLSDTGENGAKELNPTASKPVAQQKAEEPRKKKAKKGPETGNIAIDATDALPPIKKPTEVEKPKKKKKFATLPTEPVTSSSAAPPTSDTVTDQVDKPIDTPPQARSTKSKTNKKAKAQAPPKGETLTADGVNGIAENKDDETLAPFTNTYATSTSMQAEGQVTAEKELEDEWASEDEEDDQGAALLAGFDSDGDDNAEDVGFEIGQLLPKLSKKTTKKVEKAAQEGVHEGAGTVYVGRIPHGFYETQMREYFSQFGTITRLRLSRNRITGASKHFAFIEFESEEVAKIVANTMDNYLMFGHILKCELAPKESLHPALWKGANKRFRKVPFTMLEKRALEAPRTAEHWEKKNAKEQKKREQKAEKMKELGYEMKLPKLKEPREVLEERKLQNAEQQKLSNPAEVGQDEPVGAIEPPKGMPKDEIAIKAEKKPTKKNKPIQMQPKQTLVEMTTLQQPSDSTAPKREKRKEKKAKAKDARAQDAKAQQIQLDAQLGGDTQAETKETNVPAEPVKSPTAPVEFSPDKEDNIEPVTANTIVNDNDKKRTRRKTKESKAVSAETTGSGATNVANAEPSAEKPKKKKRKSDNDGEPKGILKKPGKA